MAGEIKILINTDNAAFGDTPEESRRETARILRVMADKVDEGYANIVPRDINGNKVGVFSPAEDCDILD